MWTDQLLSNGDIVRLLLCMWFSECVAMCLGTLVRCHVSGHASVYAARTVDNLSSVSRHPHQQLYLPIVCAHR